MEDNKIMFIWEGKFAPVDGGAIYDALNIKFQATQIPTGTPDVVVWKDVDGTHCKIGSVTYPEPED